MVTQQLAMRHVTTGAFTREAVEALSRQKQEPRWLLDQRLAAWELADRLPFPSSYERAWKYLNPDRLRVESMRANLSPDLGLRPAGSPLRARSAGPGLLGRALEGRGSAALQGGQAGALLLQNATVAREELDEGVSRQGVVFSSLDTAVRETPELVQRYLGRTVTADENVFTALNAAFWSGGVFVYVPKDVKVDLPLHSVLSAAGADVGLFPRLLVIADRGAEVALLDEQRGGDGAMFVSSVRELVLSAEAKVRHYAVQQWGPAVQEIYFQRANVGRNAHVVTTAAGFGASVQKGWIESNIRGVGASSNIFGLIFGSDDQYFDVITLQDHIGDHTVSDLLIKAALKDRAQSAYYGLTRVGRDARMANANQEDRNLLLSDKAKAEADPVLEILTSEVARCAHGASAGPVDEEQLFYLESRGLPRPRAEKLLVQGFLGEVLRRVPDEGVRYHIERAVAAKVEG